MTDHLCATGDCHGAAAGLCALCHQPVCRIHAVVRGHPDWDDAPRLECVGCGVVQAHQERISGLILAALLLVFGMLVFSFVPATVPACGQPPSELQAPRIQRWQRPPACVAQHRLARSHAPALAPPAQALVAPGVKQPETLR